MKQGELISIIRKSLNESSEGNGVTLHVEFYPYDRYEHRGLTKANITKDNLLDALKAMVDNMCLYVDRDRIEEDGLTAEEIIDNIADCNGDGCDFITNLVNTTTGETYIDIDYDEEEDW